MTAPRAGWRPPRAFKIALIVLCLVVGVARIAFGSGGFDIVFGVVLIVLGLSYVRELKDDPPRT